LGRKNKMAEIVFTPEQRKVADALLLNYKTIPIQTMGGYAGTGKSTLITYLREQLPNFAVCAFTGKAANVLRRKGIGSASTIHSLIYKLVPKVLPNGKIIKEFVKKEKWEIACKGFLVDEASMISTSIDRDLRSFDLPIIYVGDHGQLEPVGDNPGLMMEPMYRLETIHRNAGNIAHFANHLRRGKEAIDFIPLQGDNERGMVEFGSMDSVPDEDLLGVDQVICAYNATRCALNNMVREHHGYTQTLVENERVMCLRNNKQIGLFNGMQGLIYNLRPMFELFDFDPTMGTGIGEVIGGVSYNPKQFGQEKPLDSFGGDESRANPFDYAYCITCHKAQGDEFNNVIVIEQRCRKWDHRRWAYTAASRAKKRLIWVAE
jgi:exodeoxyribonuclease-5